MPGRAGCQAARGAGKGREGRDGREGREGREGRGRAWRRKTQRKTARRADGSRGANATILARTGKGPRAAWVDGRRGTHRPRLRPATAGRRPPVPLPLPGRIALPAAVSEGWAGTKCGRRMGGACPRRRGRVVAVSVFLALMYARTDWALFGWWRLSASAVPVRRPLRFICLPGPRRHGRPPRTLTPPAPETRVEWRGM